jgi:chemotaxis protein CheX
MKVEYINPFVRAAFSVLEMLLGEAPTKGKLTVHPNVFTSQRCNIVFGVTGAVGGSVIFGMSGPTSLQIASKMMGQPVTLFDALAASAIAEMGNMVCGNALQHLSEAGFQCDITPPTIVRGDAEISTLSVPAIVMPVNTLYGPIYMTVGLVHRK